MLFKNISERPNISNKNTKYQADTLVGDVIPVTLSRCPPLASHL